MLDPKYIPLFLGGFILWMIFVISVGFFGSCGKRSGQKFLTGGSAMSLFLIFCTLGATIIGTGSSIGAIGDGFNHGWGGAIFGLGSALGLLRSCRSAVRTPSRCVGRRREFREALPCGIARTRLREGSACAAFAHSVPRVRRRFVRWRARLCARDKARPAGGHRLCRCGIVPQAFDRTRFQPRVSF